MSALIAVEKVGADKVIDGHVVCGLLWPLAVLQGEALPQIEDRLRAIPSALRYVKDSKLAFIEDFGFTAGTYGTIVGGEHCTL